MRARLHTLRTLLFRPAVGAAGVAALLLWGAMSLIDSRPVPTADPSSAPAAIARPSPLADTDAILTTLSDAETAARRYVLTSETDERKAFTAATEKYPRQLTQLETHFAGQAEAAPHLKNLSERLVAHFGTLAEAITSAAGDDALISLMLIESEASSEVRSEITAAIRALESIELNRLEQRSHSVARRAESVQALNAGLIVFVLTLAGTGAWLLFRRVREIEGLITVCAWTRQVRWKGHWMSFEEYLAKRFRLHCTHGICEEAANKLLQEIDHADSAAPFPTALSGGQSASPFSASPFPGTPSPFPHSASPFASGSYSSNSATPFAAPSYGSPSSRHPSAPA